MTSERRSNWVDGWSQRLIRYAARRAPADLSERLEEEWLADVATRHSRVSSLSFALGCCWATGVIAHERARSLVPVGSAAGGRASLFGNALVGTRSFWRRSSTLLAVAGLHVAVFYALAVGLSPPLKKLVSHHFEAMAIPAEHRALPPLAPPTLGRPTFDAPLPRDLPPIEADEPAVRATPADSQPGVPWVEPSQPDLVPSAVSRVAGGAGAGFPVPDDFYPSAAIHMGESGAATVQVCVDRQGRLTADPVIDQSTGSPRLDGGALSLAKAGSGHYRPTTENGKPVESCYPLRIRFTLRN